jgi:hypothetical protein
VSKSYFDQFRLGFGFVIFEKCVVVFQRIGPIVQETDFIGIDDRLPLAIQIGRSEATDICDERATCARLSQVAMSIATTIVRHPSELAIEGAYSYSHYLKENIHNTLMMS